MEQKKTLTALRWKEDTAEPLNRARNLVGGPWMLAVSDEKQRVSEEANRRSNQGRGPGNGRPKKKRGDEEERLEQDLGRIVAESSEHRIKGSGESKVDI